MGPHQHFNVVITSLIIVSIINAIFDSNEIYIYESGRVILQMPMVEYRTVAKALHGQGFPMPSY